MRLPLEKLWKRQKPKHHGPEPDASFGLPHQRAGSILLDPGRDSSRNNIFLETLLERNKNQLFPFAEILGPK